MTVDPLQAELQAELQARKKQYEYYRDKLLSFDNILKRGGVVKKLNEVCEFKNGYTPSKSNKEYWDNGSIPWFRMEDIRNNGRILNKSIQCIAPQAVKSSGLFKANSIILATTATIGEHALITVDFLANQRFTCLTLKSHEKNHINIKYFYYYMYILDKWCQNNTNIANFPSVDTNALKKVEIPIPPLEVQEEIVNILDNFERMCNSLTEGLPSEIAARKKQYEYYRDKLLSF